jgi:NADH:ubiquinone oxidoreductase subunit C
MNELEQIASSLGLPETWEERNGSWWMAPASLDVRVMAAVLRSHEARFVTLTAMQLLPDERIRIDYHWDLDGRLLTFTTFAVENRVPSIVDLCEAADWVERETHENFSVEFTGRPYEPLLLRTGDASGLQLRKERP